MLIATHIPEGNAADHARWHPLQVERSATPTVNLHLITPGADEQYGAVCDKDLVFIDSGAHIDLIDLAGLFQRRARPDVRMGIPAVDD